VFQTKVVDKMKTHFMFSFYFPENHAVYEISNIPGNHEVKELQKTAILGTAHTHTSESANVEIQ
jgi:hypothetical protein